MPGNGESVMTTKSATIIVYRCVLNGFDVGLSFITIRNLCFEFILTRSWKLNVLRSIPHLSV